MALTAAVVLLAGREWALLGATAPGRAWAFGFLCALLTLAAASLPALALPVLGVATAFWLLLAPWWLARGMAAAPGGALAAAGIVALVPAGLAMALLPPWQLLQLLGLAWTSDTAAYLAGRALGRHQLAPSISPGKTREGVAGALVASALYAIIWAALDPALGARVQGRAWLAYLAAALGLCALGVVGDLFESAVKRRAGVKDSGALLPGHGGVLDRIDSVTAAAPMFLLGIRWLETVA